MLWYRDFLAQRSLAFSPFLSRRRRCLLLYFQTRCLIVFFLNGVLIVNFTSFMTEKTVVLAIVELSGEIRF